MDRKEAFIEAERIVAEWSAQVKNERGYVHDKWTPVDLVKRAAVTIQVADWLMGPPARVVPPVAWCSWCPDPPNPDPDRHPGGSPAHRESRGTRGSM